MEKTELKTGEQLKTIDYIVGNSCAFLIPEYEKEREEKHKKPSSGISVLFKNSNSKNLKDVLFVAKEAMMEEPEDFAYECLRDKKCDKCLIFKKYN
jgi:hypothetical protein